MNNVPCSVIQDLLPLYCDGVCSEESKKLVQAHIADCETCAEELCLMNAPMAAAEAEEEVQTWTINLLGKGYERREKPKESHKKNLEQQFHEQKVRSQNTNKD